MFERFTEQARHVVFLAQKEATILKHNYIGDEHLLLALIRGGRGIAAQALESLGITEDAMRQQVEKIIGHGQQDPQRGVHIPFTLGAKKTLELSLTEAIQLGHNYVGPEHILLALTREGDRESPAAQVLNGLGVDSERVRQQVIELLPDNRGKEEPGTG